MVEEEQYHNDKVYLIDNFNTRAVQGYGIIATNAGRTSLEGGDNVCYSIKDDRIILIMGISADTEAFWDEIH